MKKTLAFILSAVMLAAMLAVSVAADNPQNMWGNNLSPEEFFDGNGRDNTAIAIRFVLMHKEGTTDGRLKKINFHIAQGADDKNATCDVIIYNWAYNYDYTVAQEPIYKVNINPGDATWNWWQKGIELPDGGLAGGDYLVVMTNFQNCAWALRSNLYDKVAGIKTYKNGTHLVDRSVGWQFVFSDDTIGMNAEAVLEDVEAPKPESSSQVTEPPVASSDNTSAPAGNATDSNSATGSDDIDNKDTSDSFLTVSIAVTAVALAGACVYANKKKR